MCLGETTPGKGIAAALHHCARDNLLRRGESAASCLFSPLPTVFSRALFSTPSPLLWGTNRRDTFPRFPAQDLFSTVLCSIMEMCSFASHPKGGCGRRKVGDWGRKPRRGRGIAAVLRPPSLGLPPQDTPPRHPQSKIQQKAPPEIPGVLCPIAQRAMHQFIMVFSVSLSNR